jgi:hypothetical protein
MELRAILPVGPGCERIVATSPQRTSIFSVISYKYEIIGRHTN